MEKVKYGKQLVSDVNNELKIFLCNGIDESNLKTLLKDLFINFKLEEEILPITSKNITIYSKALLLTICYDTIEKRNVILSILNNRNIAIK
ncbi:hypothetical protein [Clostridium butyricum]|uniref:hypothetical protein n=1 Tax=Clostridium butyricum TaxID=1492 RepID=UPI00325C1139